MSEIKRSEAKPEYTWDFTPIFASDAEWEKACADAEKRVPKLAAIQGTLGKSAAALKKGFDEVFAVGEAVEKVYIYSMLRLNADNGDSKYQAMEGRATKLYINYSTVCSFINPEILAVPSDKLNEFIADPDLRGYVHIIDDINRNRPYTKDQKTEQLLAMMQDSAGTAQKSYTMLESVDISFPKITGEDGKKVQLTHGNFPVFRESGNRDLRRRAFATYFGEFGKYNNTIAALYEGNVKKDNFFSNVRGFRSACECAMFEDNADIDVYNSLVSAIHGALPTMERYLELHRKALNVQKLHMYDLYCPMVPGVDMKVSFGEARDMVKKALAPLGKDYAKMLDRAYSERWIDVYENAGKTTGAYSCGVYGVHPYVLLNYADGLDDAFTLAHELGHSMHSWYSDQSNDYANHDYRILVAEVASTVNEVLLTRYLLETEKDKARRAYILNHFLEGFRTTVFRQTLFAEFEKKAHDMEAKGQPLTGDVLNKLYRSLNFTYYRGVVNDKFMDLEWSRIPHFYNAFYVYKYATGFCSAVTIANKILNEKDGAKNYLKFLTTGGSDYPLEELKIAGVDLTKPETVESALRVFAETLDDIEKIL